MTAQIAAWVQGALDGMGGWSYAFVFAMVYVETGLLIPVPAETTLVLASALAARGRLSIGVVVMTAIVAASLGDLTAYSLGRGPGRRRLETRGRFLFLRATHVEPVRRFFDRHGGKTVFFGRFVALLRLAAAFVAGMADMPLGAFLVYNIAGGVVWASVFGAIGYWFGHSWDTIHRFLGVAGLAMVVVAVVVGVLLLRHRRRMGGDKIPGP